MANTSSCQPYVCDSDLKLYSRVVFFTLWPSAILFGIPANVINIIIFARLQPIDSLTVSFLSLSLSDLCYLLLSAAYVVCSILALEFSGQHWVIAPESLINVTYWYAYIFFDASTLITVFISVMRCCCVAMPFHFRNAFTWRRTIALVCVSFAAVALLRLPMLIVNRLAWVNATVVSVVVGDQVTALRINDLANRTVLPWSAFITVAVCLVILVVKLRGASRFRLSAGLVARVELLGHHVVNAMSVRELQMIKSVTLVSVLFVILNFPFMAYSIARRFHPEFDRTGAYSNLFGVVTTVASTCGYVNASVNAVVQYNCNSRYREAFFALFKHRSTGDVPLKDRPAYRLKFLTKLLSSSSTRQASVNL